MLSSLQIKDIILIDKLNLEFEEGLSTLTGETGAGKSILLDSLGLALGMRAESSMVRRGAEQGRVVASFDLKNDHPVFDLLKDSDIEPETPLIIRRTISSDGRSKAFINDQSVSVGLLKQVGMQLAEIHGQFDTQSLLNPKKHRALLDAYAGHEGDVIAVCKAWRALSTSMRELDDAKERMDKARQDESYYREALEDLDALSPQEGEEQKLTMLRDRLKRKEQIAESLQSAAQGLQDMESLSGSVWRSAERIGEGNETLIETLDRLNAELQEAQSNVQDVFDSIEGEGQSLEEIDDRLYALKSQARKHDCQIEELPQKREDIAQALNGIESQDDQLASLMKQVEEARGDYMKKAQALSNQRRTVADKMCALVMQELPPLKLDKARFEVSIEALHEEQWGENGIDTIQFVVATNPGAAAGPLNKIASGGEMARFMLALKVVLAEVGIVQTYVFDELDSGVGGATAAAVGERLARLARTRQILTVTHSPQVAAMASHHWIVQKSGNDDHVTTTVIPLNEQQQRTEEIARMISGADITDEARAAAGKLLEAA